MASYEFTGAKWGTPAFGSGGGEVTWSFGSGAGVFFGFDARIDDLLFQALVREAFNTWESVAAIDFVEVADTAASSIRLGWDAIDGGLGTAAQAGYSYQNAAYKLLTKAEIRFDTAESWSTAKSYGTSALNFFAVALHEIGHAIGLDHTDDRGTVMYPVLGPQVTLSSGDTAGAQLLYGSATGAPGPAMSGIGNDTLSGGDANDVLTGFAGDDVLFGSRGNDTVQGNQGADTIGGGEGQDTVEGGKDNDLVTGNEGSDLVYGNLGNDVADGGSDDDIVWGGNADPADLFDGADTLSGGFGNDFVHGNSGNDTVNGNAGNDEVHGGKGDDQVQGGQGDDKVFGDFGSDDVYGNLGNDQLNGGAGVDVLTGGAGSDVFIFDRGQANGDTITEFNSAEDQLLFSGYGPGASATALDQNHWRIASGDGSVVDVITIGNSAALGSADFEFV